MARFALECVRACVCSTVLNKFVVSGCCECVVHSCHFTFLPTAACALSVRVIYLITHCRWFWSPLQSIHLSVRLTNHNSNNLISRLRLCGCFSTVSFFQCCTVLQRPTSVLEVPPLRIPVCDKVATYGQNTPHLFLRIDAEIRREEFVVFSAMNILSFKIFHCFFLSVTESRQG